MPLTLGSPGNAIHNAAAFTIGSTFGTSVVNVVGNLSNTADIEVASQNPPRPPYGSSTLNVSGTLTNQATGTLNVNFPLNQPYVSSPGSLNVQNLVNDGTATFNAQTASTAQSLENKGTVNILGDDASHIGSLTVGTLKPEAGLVHVWSTGGLLVVGSGTLPSGTTGYYQFANGVLDAAGGGLQIDGPVDLNGTLDIMLGNGYKPVGTVFTLLTGGAPAVLSGTFSNVEGLVLRPGKVCAYLLRPPARSLRARSVFDRRKQRDARTFLRVFVIAGTRRNRRLLVARTILSSVLEGFGPRAFMKAA